MARDASGNKTVDLEYKTRDGVSKLITSNSDGSLKDGFKFTVKTSNEGIAYPFKERYVNDINDKKIDNLNYEANYPYMLYINLGLKKRETADFALMKDVGSATLTINKKQLNYTYNARQNIDGFDINIKKQNDYKNMKYNRAIYESDYNFRIEDYKNSDRGIDNPTGSIIHGTKTEDQELKVFVTYYMKIRNQSGVLAGTINELVDYYDETYNLVSEDVKLPIQDANGKENPEKIVAQHSFYITSTGKIGDVVWSDKGKYDQNFPETGLKGLKSMYTQSLADLILQPGEDVNVYVTFEVQKDNERSIKTGEKSNFIEINNFTALEGGAQSKDQIYGQVDKDSAPGNYNPLDDDNTKEDDSDSAPSINIKQTTEKRSLNGKVWEDERTKKLSTGQIVGDGLMDASEKAINGVIVQLIEVIDNPGGDDYEYIWQEMKTSENGYMYIDSSGSVKSGTRGTAKAGTKNVGTGEYEFENYIPGNYRVRFIYGSDDSTVLPEKNDGVSYNGHDYKSTTYQLGQNLETEWYDLSRADLNDTRMSDAKDNEKRRLDVINYSKVMKNKIAEILDYPNSKNKNVLKELEEKTSMHADTAKLKVEVEYDRTEADGQSNYDYTIKNIDFGLEKRPKNDMNLTKEIVGIKFTTADGEVIVDTEKGIRKNVSWQRNTKDLKGKIQIYMDQELMQGAKIEITYRIKVKNTGEIDTIGSKENSVGLTYYTGEVSSSDKIVETSYDKIIDFADNNLVFKKELNPDWELIENTDLGSVENMQNENNGYLDSKIKYARMETRDGKLKEVSITQILVTEALKDQKLKPGDESKTPVYLTLTKTISSADHDDDLTYDNMAEIIQFTNDVGRRGYVPGNQDPNKKPGEKDADYTETIVITPPTGANKSTIYLLIIAAVLATIGGTVYFIKRKILGK